MRASLTPITREARRPDGVVIREFDVGSAAQVLGALFGAIFLVFFLMAFLPWVVVKGTTAAVEGLMSRVGFGDFTASTIWSWTLVLIVGAAFVLFLVTIITSLLALYNVLSERTGHGLQLRSDFDPDQRVLDVGGRRVLPAADVVSDGDDDDVTFDDLYAEAQRRQLAGRSTMSKAELQSALRRQRRTRKATKSAKSPKKSKSTQRSRSR